MNSQLLLAGRTQIVECRGRVFPELIRMMATTRKTTMEMMMRHQRAESVASLLEVEPWEEARDSIDEEAYMQPRL
jgi:hypothetical protein